MSKTKDAILQAAIQTFSDKGYDAATVDDIAIKAGVAKGTFYYHFKSKEELFNFIIANGIDIIKYRFEAMDLNENDSLNKIKEVCKLQLELVVEHKEFFKVVMSELWGKQLRQYYLREIFEKYVEYIEKFIKEAVDAKAIIKGDTKYMAYAFVGVLFSTAIYEIINNGERPIDELIENLIHYMLSGIQVRQ